MSVLAWTIGFAALALLALFLVIRWILKDMAEPAADANNITEADFEP